MPPSRRQILPQTSLALVLTVACQHGASAADPAAAPVTDTGKTETINVNGGMATANGVTNTTPGGGLMPVQTASKSISSVTRDYIAKQPPTSNPLSLVQDLPGVIVASADPLGMTDHMGVSIRALSQNEVGSLYEGMPASDPVGYLPYTTEWADTDNISRVDIQKGAPNITDPLYNSVGGTISVSLRDPSERPGALVDLTYGSKSLQREFGRIDTGELGHTGVRGYISFSDATWDEWRGSGSSRREHVDAKFVKDWGNGNSFSPRISWNSLAGATDTYPTMAQFKEFGRNYNYTDDYSFGNTRSQRFYVYYRDTIRLNAPTVIHLTDNLTVTTNPFWLYIHSTPNGATTLSEDKSFFGDAPAGPLNLPYSVGGNVTAESLSVYTHSYAGLNSYLSWKLGHQLVRAGYWYGYYNYVQATSFAVANFQGHVGNDYGSYPIRTASGAVLRTYDGHLVQQTNGLYIDDTIKLLGDRLTLNAGFKTVMINRAATDLVPGATYNAGVNDFEPLPQISASYNLSPRDQIYADVATAFSEPGSSYFDIFSPATGKLASAHSPDLRPEYSISEEVGFRHHGFFNFAAVFFNYNLTNKQISSSQLVSGVPTSTIVNIGGQTTRGVEAEVSLRAWHHLSPYASGQYINSTTDNNIVDGRDYLPTKGKTSILAPKFSGALGLAYDNGSIFGNFSLNYVDSQYSTFMNDESIPSYLTANASLGYRFSDFGPTKHPQIQISFVNIGDENYISGAFGITGNAKATRGVFGTTLAGSAPTYWIGGGFGTYVSLTTGF